MLSHNNQNISYIINVYSDNNQEALQVLWDNVRNIENIVAIMDNFNIRDCDWNPSFFHYSIYTENLTLIANSLDLELSSPYNLGPTRYTDNPRDTNSVLDLVFLSFNTVDLPSTSYSQTRESHPIMFLWSLKLASRKKTSISLSDLSKRIAKLRKSLL